MSPEKVYEDPAVASAEDAIAIVQNGAMTVISDQRSLNYANEILIQIKTLRHRFDLEFDPGVKQAFDHHRFLVAQKRKWTDPLDQAERALKPKIAAYLREQDTIRMAAQREAELARKRIEAEAYKASDAAHELVREGRLDEVDEVTTKAADRIQEIQKSVPVVPEKVEAEGSSLRERWTWDRDNVDIDAMANDDHARPFLKVDEAKVTRYVQNMKRDAKIAGIRIFAIDDVATKARK